MSSGYPTTEEHLSKFRTVCKEEAAAYGLSDWRLVFDWEDLGSTASAAVAIDNEARVCRFSLNKSMGVPVTRARILDHARHEVLELLLNELAEVALPYLPDSAPDAFWTAVRTCKHAVIQRLINRWQPIADDEITFNTTRTPALEHFTTFSYELEQERIKLEKVLAEKDGK